MAAKKDASDPSDLSRLAATLRELRPRLAAQRRDEIKRNVLAREGRPIERAATREADEPTPGDLSRLAQVLRDERPRPSARTLDEIKRDVLAREGRPRPVREPGSLRRHVVAVALSVGVLAIGTSSVAASFLDWASGASFGSKILGYDPDAEGVQFFFGTIAFGADASDRPEGSTDRGR
jgi:hypothetical protein